MQNISNKESDQSSVHSTSPYIVNGSSWWNSSGAQIPQSSLSKNLNLSLDSQTQDCHNMKRLGLQLQDQDSSSTQSTGQSHHIAAGAEGGNAQGKCTSAQSGYVETCGKRNDGVSRPVLSFGSPDPVHPPSQVDFSQSVARVPYSYADPYFGGLLAAYGPQAIIHSQILGMAHGRVPLPLGVAEDMPIYVNPKQYRRIIQRRQLRAKMEAQNKVPKGRKRYLHESRHVHAMNRVRGAGGRFLNTKNPQEPKLTPTNDSTNLFSATLLHQGGSVLESNVPQSKNGGTGASATSSDITSVSNNDDVYQQSEHGFSSFHSRTGGSLQYGGGGRYMRSGTPK